MDRKLKQLLKWREEKLDHLDLLWRIYLKKGWSICLEYIAENRLVLLEIQSKIREYESKQG